MGIAPEEHSNIPAQSTWKGRERLVVGVAILALIPKAGVSPQRSPETDILGQVEEGAFAVQNLSPYVAVHRKM